MKIEDMDTHSLERLNDLLERLAEEPAAVRLKLSISDELNIRSGYPGVVPISTMDLDAFIECGVPMAFCT